MSHDAYSALSDPTRRRILAVLQDGARPVGDLVTELGVSQPTVSKHLKVLRDAGMVTTRAQGQKRFYSIVGDPLVPVVDWLAELVAAAQTTPHDDVPEDAAATPPAAAPSGDSDPAPTSDDAVRPAPADPTEPVAGRPLTTPAPAERGHGAEERAETAVPADDEPGSPAPTTSERSIPWFTAEVSEVTELAASGTAGTQTAEAEASAPEVAGSEVEAAVPSDGQAVDATGSWTTDGAPETTADESPASIEPEEQGGAAEPDEQGAVAPVEGFRGDAEREAGTEPGDAAASVEDDARASTTVQSGDSPESEPGGVAPRGAFEQVVASENGEPLRPRGGAHRRQSGLLSTLTGFRRRGRGSRRD